jgi:hypothetical protein
VPFSPINLCQVACNVNFNPGVTSAQALVDGEGMLHDNRITISTMRTSTELYPSSSGLAETVPSTIRGARRPATPTPSRPVLPPPMARAAPGPAGPLTPAPSAAMASSRMENSATTETQRHGWLPQ